MADNKKHRKLRLSCSSDPLDIDAIQLGGDEPSLNSIPVEVDFEEVELWERAHEAYKANGQNPEH